MDKQKQASTLSGGIFLIGLGILIITGWWWPGIMASHWPFWRVRADLPRPNHQRSRDDRLLRSDPNRGCHRAVHRDSLVDRGTIYPDCPGRHHGGQSLLSAG